MYFFFSDPLATPEIVLCREFTISCPLAIQGQHTVKTADRILQTACLLFNERGERNVTASDIALELDMSAGNLYYHFKGKDSMHLALFATLQRELVGLLGAPLHDPLLFRDNDEDDPVLRSWLFLTVVLEKMLAYRYLYENPRDLMH